MEIKMANENPLVNEVETPKDRTIKALETTLHLMWLRMSKLETENKLKEEKIKELEKELQNRGVII